MPKPKQALNIKPQYVAAYLYFALGVICGGAGAGHGFNLFVGLGMTMLIVPMFILILKDINDYYYP